MPVIIIDHQQPDQLNCSAILAVVAPQGSKTMFCQHFDWLQEQTQINALALSITISTNTPYTFPITVYDDSKHVFIIT